MKSEKEKVLLRVGVELYYRASRIKRILESVGGREAKEYKQLIKTTIAAVESIQQVLPNTVEASTLMAALPGAQHEKVFFNELCRFSKWFVAIHGLLIHFPTYSVLPETVFMLEEAFKPGDFFSRLRPATTLGSLFNPLEFDFYHKVGMRLPGLEDINQAEAKNIVLQLPLCDRISPGGWPALAHELGHTIENEYDIGKKAAAGVVAHNSKGYLELMTTWGKEFAADIIAAEMLGPSVALALMSNEYCVYPIVNIHSSEQDHPPTGWRVRVMEEFLKKKYSQNFLSDECTNYNVAWNYSLERESNGDGTFEERNQGAETCFQAAITPMTKKIKEEVSAIIKNDHRINQGELKVCEENFKNGVPASSQPLLQRAALKEKINLFRSMEFADKPAQYQAFGELIKNFTEKPINIQTILLACHKRRSDIFNKAISEDTALADKGFLGSMCVELERLDDLVVRSIGANVIHNRILNKIGHIT